MVSYKYIAYILMLSCIFSFHIGAMDKPQKEIPDIWTAAQEGNIAVLQQWIENKSQIPGGIDGKKNGITPLLALASTPRDKVSPHVYNEGFKLLLDAGADITNQDPEGLTVLHKVAMRGAPWAFQVYLSKNPRLKQIINMQAGPEKRTPLMMALRALPEGLIRLHIAYTEYMDRGSFKIALQKAFKELDDKIARKPEFKYIITLLVSFIKEGADINIPDKAGHHPIYYIDNFLILSEQQQKSLLAALKMPYMPNKLRYSMVDLSNALREIDELTAKNPKFAQKLTMVRWILEDAIAESQEDIVYKLLRVALAILAKINFDSQNNITKKLQAIVHDAAIQLISQPKALPR